MLSYSEVVGELPQSLQNNVILPWFQPLATTAFLAGQQSVDLSAQMVDVVQFMLTAIVGRVYVDGAPQTPIADPSLRVNVQFSTGQNMTKGAAIWGAVVTTPSSANVGLGGLPAAWRVPGGTSVTITVSNFGVAGTHYWVDLALVGFNVFNLLRTA